MAQQKLYTEEQVKQMIEKSRETGLTAEYLTLVTSSIKLPTDEEIYLQIEKTKNVNLLGYPSSFRKGAKWMRDQILNKQHMAQQTAVEWLMQNIEKSLPNFIEVWREEFEQAKQMEKEQIKKAWFDSTLQFDNAASMVDKKEFEQYYNETYGK